MEAQFRDYRKKFREHREELRALREELARYGRELAALSDRIDAGQREIRERLAKAESREDGGGGKRVAATPEVGD